MAKYRNIPTMVGDIKFDSKKEAARYVALLWLEKGGQIKDLRLQVKYKIVVESVLICTYIADFVYFDLVKNKEVVEDVKGIKTPAYNLKKKLMLACYKIEILET